ncbi:MAG: Cys-tRNA(Pro) deacylase [Anaerolineae bacterium]
MSPKKSREERGKTLAMRVLEGADVPYEVYEFPDTVHDAVEVAQHTGMPPQNVYKTLVVQAEDTGFKPMLVMIAADRQLNLKKLASAVGAKKVRMARHEDAERLTGLKTGGISALALLNRGFLILIDEQAILLDRVLVSAGQRGINLGVSVEDLIRVTGAEIADVT